jgi:ATP-binding protein involved in chromosome partitioning
VKGIEMFDLLRVPTVAVVENMAEFTCGGCGSIHRPFGPGYLNMLKTQFGIKHSVSIPLQGDVSKFSDLGSPVVMTLPESHEINQIYRVLAESVVEELNRV